MAETDPTTSHATSAPDSAASSTILWIVFALLPLVLLGLGFYFVNIEPGVTLAGIAQNVWFGVGQSVMASALVALVMLVGTWADRRTARAESQMLRRTLEEFRQTSELVKTAGLRRVHPDRYIRSVYQDHQGRVRERLDLLGMSLKHFQQDVGDDLVRWVTERDQLEIRILVPEPCGAYCRTRDVEEGRPAGDTSEWVLRLTDLVLRSGHARIQIRWHSTIPTVSIYRLDDVVFVGPYLINRLSRLTTTLEVDSKSILAEQYLLHFESLWTPPREHPEWSRVPTAQEALAARSQLGR
ncbi:MAG: hypothetical protein IT379_41975 [Deltaproteobacteria bacterium]|nr:hypothetical protein [Deltaproteobacteria bacterium]